MGLESWAESSVASHFLFHINGRQVAFLLHKTVRYVEKMGSIAACIPTSLSVTQLGKAIPLCISLNTVG